MKTEEIESLLSGQPHSPLFAYLANEYFTAGKIEEAKNLCLTGIEQYPTYSTAHLVLSKCFALEGNYAQALESLQHAILLMPDAVNLRNLETQWGKRVNQTSETQVEHIQNIIEEQRPILEELNQEEFSQPSAEGPQYNLIEEQTITVVSDLDQKTEVEISSPEAQPVEIQVHDFPSSEPADEQTLTEIIPDENTLPSIADEQQAPIQIISDNFQEEETLNTPVQQSDLNIELYDQKDAAQLDEAAEKTTHKEETPPNIFDDGIIVSKTLAEIYATQGAYEEAIITYRLLKQLLPEQSNDIEHRIHELESKLNTRIAPQ